MNDIQIRGCGFLAMDHVIGAEGSAYKARHRPGEGKTRNGKASGKYIFCLYFFLTNKALNTKFNAVSFNIIISLNTPFFS